MFRIARVVGVAIATFTAAALPLMTAAPAQAGLVDCVQVLDEAGYKVTRAHTDACAEGRNNNRAKCEAMLRKLDVAAKDASLACERAYP
jgi:hypothetical protein